MFRIPMDALRPGMIVGKNVIGNDGRILLHAGTELRERYIEILKRIGSPSVYITNELAPDVDPQDVVSDRNRTVLSSGLRDVVGEITRTVSQSAKQGQRRLPTTIDFTKLKQGVDSIVTDLLHNPTVMVNLQDIRSADDYTLGHSVNVCVLAVLVGLSAGTYNVKQLNELGLGALMHDIGKVAIAKELVQKDGSFDPEETEIMKTHTALGWEILSKQSEISFLSSAVALQHHERWSGGGYPRGIKGEEIHDYARITSIVDVFDAMVTDRPYRAGYHPLRALRTMTELTADYFEPTLLEIFAESVAVYPVGSLVEITGGYQAVVVSVERGKNLRPKVRVVRDPSGAVLAKSADIDLSAHPGILIMRTIQDEVSEFSTANLS